MFTWDSIPWATTIIISLRLLDNLLGPIHRRKSSFINLVIFKEYLQVSLAKNFWFNFSCQIKYPTDNLLLVVIQKYSAANSGQLTQILIRKFKKMQREAIKKSAYLENSSQSCVDQHLHSSYLGLKQLRFNISLKTFFL